MRRGANPAVCLFYLVTALFQVVHKLTQVRCRKILSRYNHGGRMRGEANWFEVTFGVILDVWCKHGRGDMRTHAPGQQGIAIGLRGRDARATQCATGAAYILNYHLLTERPAHVFRHNTRHNITRAAGREWDDDRNRSSRICLRMGNEW